MFVCKQHSSRLPAILIGGIDGGLNACRHGEGSFAIGLLPDLEIAASVLALINQAVEIAAAYLTDGVASGTSPGYVKTSAS